MGHTWWKSQSNSKCKRDFMVSFCFVQFLLSDNHICYNSQTPNSLSPIRKKCRKCTTKIENFDIQASVWQAVYGSKWSFYEALWLCKCQCTGFPDKQVNIIIKVHWRENTATLLSSRFEESHIRASRIQESITRFLPYHNKSSSKAFPDQCVGHNASNARIVFSAVKIKLPFYSIVCCHVVAREAVMICASALIAASGHVIMIYAGKKVASSRMKLSPGFFLKSAKYGRYFMLYFKITIIVFRFCYWISNFLRHRLGNWRKIAVIIIWISSDLGFRNDLANFEITLSI